MSRYLTPDGVVIEGKPVTHKSGERFIKDPQSGGFWRLADCKPIPGFFPGTGKTSLPWDDPRLVHRHRLKGSGIPWAKPLSDGIPPWRWDGYWCEEDREDGGSHA